MFGHNTPRGSVEPRGHERPFDGKLQVREIFTTIQGEGPFAGLPAVFIRLTGCNLRCWFCDTEWDDENDQYMTPGEIAATCAEKAGSASLVVITGGEPARQPLGELIAELRSPDLGLSPPFKVQIETAGTFWQDCFLADGVTVVISPKTARVHQNFVEHQNSVFWKYVISADSIGGDGFPKAPMQRHIRKPDERNGGAPFIPPYFFADNLFFQPCDEYDEAKNKANIAATVRAAQITGGRAQLQLHKYFELP